MTDISPAAVPRGIGGWLLLPAAGLVLSVGVGLYGISDIVMVPEMLSTALFYKASISLIFIGTVLFWIGLPVAALVLLLLRSRRFPRAFIAASVAQAAFGVLDTIIMDIDYDFSPTSLLYGAIPAVWFLGWSWYMLSSIRVKNTFVK